MPAGSADVASGKHDLLDGYAPGCAYDEMYEAADRPRDHYRALSKVLGTLTHAEYSERCRVRDRAFSDQGITFQLSGQEERPFPLDLVPRVIDADDWAVIDAGVKQRVKALEAFLADVYGAGEILQDGIIPRSLVVSSEHFHRAAAGIEPANGVRVHVAGIDLIRDVDGRYRVLEDNLRTPSGVSYVLENRRAMTHVFPEMFGQYRIRRVSEYPQRLLNALRAAAPKGVDEPNVVVLTPGVHNSAYFEHSFLARQMGVELVEGRDLVCRENSLYMRTTEGERRVDVVYRRVDDEFLDPLHFHANSILGCAGIVNAARAGRVTISNGVGNGVADDKAVYPYVPQMIEYYLNEKAILDNVDTWRCGEPEHLEYVLARVEQLVFKPVDASGGYGLVIGPQASADELLELRHKVIDNPRGWIAQTPIALSTSPTFNGTGMAPRHIDLRPFAINDGRDVWVVPGGLTRVALREGSLIVNSSQGGGSKDTWVLAAPDEAPTNDERASAEPVVPQLASRPLVAGPGLVQAAQQQQQ
ncbi:MAG: circularly permuted type 2 ATP-grasp protein [Acidimicrobiia bacterium]